MATRRKGTYFNGQEHIPCQIKRMGPKKTRLILEDGTEQFVNTKCVKIDATGQLKKDTPERLIPTTALESFYRSIRSLTGSKVDRFRTLCTRLDGPYGQNGAAFLAELFRRSVRHAESYANIDEAFYSVRTIRDSTERPFARRFVEKLSESSSMSIGSSTLAFLDYEIFPFRTTYSRLENGNVASRSGSGGMDILLASNGKDGAIPAVGEVKAVTETVGPTFGLVQSLMYASQLATPNQFMRLRRHYPKALADITPNKPRIDVLVFLEATVKKTDTMDLDYALALGKGVANRLSEYLRNLFFVQCTIAKDAIECAVIKA